jgi:hypothetical protein
MDPSVEEHWSWILLLSNFLFCWYALLKSEYYCAYLLRNLRHTFRPPPLQSVYSRFTAILFPRELLCLVAGYLPPKRHLKTFLRAAQSCQLSKYNQLSPDEHKSLEN